MKTHLLRTSRILALFILCAVLMCDGFSQSTQNPPIPRYDVIDLGVGNAAAGPTNKTHAVGWLSHNGDHAAVLFYDGEKVIQFNLPSSPFDLNERDEILLSLGRIFSRNDGTVRTIALTANKLNNFGFVVGYATFCWLPEGAIAEICEGRPALISPGGAATPLEADFRNLTTYQPLALNDRFEIVGQRAIGNPAIPIAVYQESPGAPMRDLPVPPSELGHRAWRINENGQIIINSFGRGPGDFLFSGEQMIPLGTLFQGGTTHAIALNRWGTVVGQSDTIPSTTAAGFLYDGKIRNLNHFIPLNSPWHVASAFGINDYGEILAIGLPKNNLTSAVHNMLLLKPNSTVRYYYAIGDSVASGHGLVGDDANGCRQTLGAYPNRVASKADGDLQMRGNFACSGATSADLPDQVTSVINDLITVRQRNPVAQATASITIGANDIRWSNFLELSQLLCSPDAAYSEMKQQIMSGVSTRVQSGVERLLNQNVQVILTEYHNPFNSRNSRILQLLPCTILPNDMRKLFNRTQDLTVTLNQTLTNIATHFGADKVRIAEVYQAFQQHGSASPFCGDGPPREAKTWIQLPRLGPSISDFFECFHPNDVGADMYATAVARVLR